MHILHLMSYLYVLDTLFTFRHLKVYYRCTTTHIVYNTGTKNGPQL